MEKLLVNGIEYEIIKLLGKGKGGYSYLAKEVGKDIFKAGAVSENPCKTDAPVVLKQIHHEPCAYYTFGNKIEAERHDYQRLCVAGIRVPRMIQIDTENERIVKEFIDGPTVFELVRDQDQGLEDGIFTEVRKMAELAKNAGLNIDYFPTNFVLKDGLLYYVDYECNPYSDEWNFENWGVKYWWKSPEFLEYLKNH